MSKPTIDDVIYAVYLIGVNLNGVCVYCGLNMSGSKPEVKARHYKVEHSK